jgi:hypothetical protein
MLTEGLVSASILAARSWRSVGMADRLFLAHLAIVLCGLAAFSLSGDVEHATFCGAVLACVVICRSCVAIFGLQRRAASMVLESALAVAKLCLIGHLPLTKIRRAFHLSVVPPSDGWLCSCLCSCEVMAVPSPRLSFPIPQEREKERMPCLSSQS